LQVIADGGHSSILFSINQHLTNYRCQMLSELTVWKELLQKARLILKSSACVLS